MRPWLKLLLFLLPAFAAALFPLWRMSPGQTVIRRADLLFTSLEKKALDTGTTRTKADRFSTLLHPDFTVKAPLPIPSGPVPPETAADLVEEFHDSILSCRISLTDRRVTFPSNGRAVFEATLQADLSTGPSSRRVLRYRCQLELEKDGRAWLLHHIVLTPI